MITLISPVLVSDLICVFVYLATLVRGWSILLIFSTGPALVAFDYSVIISSNYFLASHYFFFYFWGLSNMSVKSSGTIPQVLSVSLLFLLSNSIALFKFTDSFFFFFFGHLYFATEYMQVFLNNCIFQF